MKTTYELKKDVLEAAGVCDVTEELIRNYEEQQLLTENTGRDNKNYIWFMDNDGSDRQACLCVDTMEYVSEGVIMDQLACPDYTDIDIAKGKLLHATGISEEQLRAHFFELCEDNCRDFSLNCNYKGREYIQLNDTYVWIDTIEFLTAEEIEECKSM